MGIELLAGYAVAYLVRKLRRVGHRADREVDRALDTGMDRLHDLIGRVLGDDPALRKLESETGSGTESERTVQRLRLAIEAAAEADAAFAAELEKLVTSVRAAEVHAEGQGVAAGGDISVRATDHGVAAVTIHGSVSTGTPPAPGSAPS
ncbi:chromosome partitioning protein [Nocardia aurantia]|uniref:Chromosome partitioning protein n=1 Tax=Nocardia aurantia TaxID=2585199 RepID=A0A7K0DTA4_9NOCA|nr:chromosome partitioning protein [Nocardia aurantia]MQY28808.1 hypothetical protein [Nocardia aurantia]